MKNVKEKGRRKMAIYGYAKRNYPFLTTVQLSALDKYGCDDIFIEAEEFGADSELENMIKKLQLNDQLIVYDMRFLFQGFNELKRLLEFFKNKNIELLSIRDELDTKENIFFLEDVLLLIRTEQSYRRDFIKHRIAKSRSEGRNHGRPQISEEIVTEIRFLFDHKKKSMREISKICGVSLGTVHKYTRKVNYEGPIAKTFPKEKNTEKE